jgi:predicted RNase H-like HicB family nuclease
VINDPHTFSGLNVAIATFIATGAASVPADTFAAVIAAQGAGSPYDRFVPTLEAVFAAGDDADEVALELCQALAAFVSTTFAPLPGPDPVEVPSDPTRAPGIVRACRRRRGELSEAEAPPAADPAPLPAYLPA